MARTRALSELEKDDDSKLTDLNNPTRSNANNDASLKPPAKRQKRKFTSVGYMQDAMETIESAALEPRISELFDAESHLLDAIARQTYSHNIAQDHARMHVGNVYHTCIHVHRVVGNDCLQVSQKISSERKSIPNGLLVPRRLASFRGKKGAKEWTIKLRPGWTSWFWSLTVQKSISGWHTYLETFNLVPYSSKIFELCRAGDQNGVRELLETGQASPTDYNEGHVMGVEFPFHLAMRSRNVELCKYLLKLTGLPRDMYPGEFDWNHFYIVRPGDLTSNSRLDALRLLVESFDLDCEEIIGNEGTKPPYWYRCNDGHCSQLMQNSLSRQYTTLSLTERLDNFTRLSLEPCPDQTHLKDGEESFQFFMRGIAFDTSSKEFAKQTEFAKLIDSSGRSVFHLTGLFGWRLKGPWSTFFRHCLKAGADIHRLATLHRTPLGEICSQFFWINMEHAWDLVLDWLEWLVDNGVNLISYAKREADIIISFPIETPQPEDYDTQVKVTGLRYGSSPDFWDVCLDFLDRIRLWRPLVLPGQWIEEHDDLPSVLPWMPNTRDFSYLPLQYRTSDAWTSSERRTCMKTTIRDFIQVLSDIENIYDEKLGPQDDHGFISLEFARSALHKRYGPAWGRRRAHSEPPVVPTVFRDAVYYHEWQVPRTKYVYGQIWTACHRCALNGRWKLGPHDESECFSQSCGITDDIWTQVEGGLLHFRMKFPTRYMLKALPYAAYHGFKIEEWAFWN